MTKTIDEGLTGHHGRPLVRASPEAQARGDVIYREVRVQGGHTVLGGGFTKGVAKGPQRGGAQAWCASCGKEGKAPPRSNPQPRKLETPDPKPGGL